jgi:DNA-directed RNA polymerase specialized sigma24 family protein
MAIDNTAPTAEEIELAQNVARRIASKWKQVETEDVQQHLVLWLYENTTALARWRTEEGGQGKLYVSLRREASKYCAKETEETIGVSIDADNIYTVETVAAALPFMWELTESAKSSTLGSDATAILADISSAFYGRSKDDQQALTMRYRDGHTYDQIAEYFELGSKMAAHRMVDRALKYLVAALAGEAPHENRNRKENLPDELY